MSRSAKRRLRAPRSGARARCSRAVSGHAPKSSVSHTRAGASLGGSLGRPR